MTQRVEYNHYAWTVTQERLDDDAAVRTGVAGDPATLDVECQDGRRHGPRSQQSSVVHAQPWDSQRGVLPTPRSRLPARPGPDRDRLPRVLFRGKTRNGQRGRDACVWHA